MVEGYGDVAAAGDAVAAARHRGSLFQYAFSSAGGIDPYAAAVSDVYQDLFGEGSYAGKGIYDVDVFEQALAGRVPENTLLSHDLFEGIFARAGLASDIEVIEEFPPRYDVAAPASIAGRAATGSCCPGSSVAPRRAFRAVGRWKMLDNLRRSLTPPATVLALFVGWLLPQHQASAMDRLRAADARVAAVVAVLAAIVPRPRTDALAAICGRSRRPAACRDPGGAGGALLADQAWLMVDAIVRTLFRLSMTRRNLLEWTSFDQARALSAARARRPLSPDARHAGRGGAGRAAVRRGAGRVGLSPRRSRCCGSPRPRSRGGSAAALPAATARRSGDRRAGAAHGRAAYLAVFRNLRHGGRQHAAAGQLSGGSEAGRRAPHVAHQHRTVSALDRAARDSAGSA